MANQVSTIQIPSWIKEVSDSPQKYVKESLKSFVFFKMQEYQRQKEMFEHKYQLPFEEFEKRVKSLEKENFEMWDDYLEWRVIDSVYKKWLKRYHKL